MRARLPRLSDHSRPVRSLLGHSRRAGRAAGGVHRKLGGATGAPPDGAPEARRAQAPAGPQGRAGDGGDGEEVLTPEARHREGAVPQDLAHYSCPCGYRFEAKVSTSVHCPHCGDTQAW